MMPTHIQQTLDELQAQLQAITVARDALLALYAAAPVVTVPPTVTAAPRRSASTKAAAKKAVAKTSTPAAVAPKSRAQVGQWDSEVRDALTLAPPVGVTASDIARRLVANPADKDRLEAMVQRVWSVLQRLVATGEAVKDGRYYRRIVTVAA